MQQDTLLSLSENPDYTSTKETPASNRHFQIHRIFIFVMTSIIFMIVFFLRACPTVVTDELAKAYNVPITKLGIFTSMFYIPYSFLQPFAGLVSDVMEPAFIIGCSIMVASLGSIICGLSKSLFIGCIGRIIVGAGCGLMYSPCNRILLNWFQLKHYPKILGVFLLVSGLGNFLAQTPLTLLAQLIGWRWCFLAISFFSIFLAVLYLFFVRGNPIVFNYPPVNANLAENVGDYTFRQKAQHLVKNFKTIASNRNFWLIAIFVFFGNGAYYNITGIWGSPYLKENLHYDSVKASNALLGLSIGACLGSFVNPFILDLFPSKKWTTFVENFLAILCCIPTAFFSEKLNFVSVIILFTLFAFLTTGAATIIYPYCVEFFHPSSGSSAVGCLNCFAFISLIIFMPLTGEVLEHFGTLPDNPDIHNPDGFKYGLWVFNICGLSLGNIVLLFVGKPKMSEYAIETLSIYEQA